MGGASMRHSIQGKARSKDMDYKTVMVSLALDRPNDACLAVAGNIAERFGTRVIGIAASDLRPALYFAEGEYAHSRFREWRLRGMTLQLPTRSSGCAFLSR